MADGSSQVSIFSPYKNTRVPGNEPKLLYERELAIGW